MQENDKWEGKERGSSSTQNAKYDMIQQVKDIRTTKIAVIEIKRAKGSQFVNIFLE